jgi:hypothetical protein
VTKRSDDVTGRWTLRPLAVVLAAVAGLGGCASKQEASQSLPTTSAAPSTKTLPPLGPKDLPMPTEARTQDAAGAEAFVRYYIALINRTSTVMDAKPLRDFSKNCRDCDRIATNTEKDAAARHDYEHGEITITQVLPPLLSGATASINIVIDQAPLTVVDSARRPISNLGSGAYTKLPGGIGLTWDASRESWLMTDFTVG